MLIRILLISLVTICFSGANGQTRHSGIKRTAHATPKPVQPRRMNTFQILTNPNLWRQDFALVLAQLPALQRAGESKLLVFPDKAVSGTAVRTPDEARNQRQKIETAMEQMRANPTPLARKLMARTTPRSLKTDVLANFPEDDSARVATESLQLFPAGMRVETVRRQLGAPEKTTRVMVESEGERRPLILTLYSYAGGAVVFAEADIAPRPGAVDRVILDIPAVTSALEKEVP